MATTQLGQYRYTGRNCVNKINTRVELISTNINTGNDAANAAFQDVKISLENGTIFQKNVDYYLNLTIPQDINYAMNFTVKLMKNSASNDMNLYQYIRSISVPVGGTGGNSYKVVLYPDNSNEAKAMIPLAYKSGSKSIENALYEEFKEGKHSKYYIGKNGLYEEKKDYNEIIMAATWVNSDVKSCSSFEMVFRPVEDFDYILLQMSRESIDYNIQHATDSGIQYGRVVDINAIPKGGISAYSLKNLVDSMNNGGELSRIGVWGHSGQLMSINGEEIRIGPSGFYELSELAISSLGIVAFDNNYENSFTVDYEFVRKDEKGV